MYSIVIAPKEGEPEVASDRALTIEYALSRATEMMREHTDEHYCEIDDDETGECILAASYTIPVAASINEAQQYQSDAQQSQRNIQEV